MKRYFLVLLLIFCGTSAQLQNLSFARSIDSTLSSPDYGGRGYVDAGENMAANFIASQMENLGLEKFGKSYLQPFKFPINTIVSDKGVKVDEKKLIPGTEYLIAANSPSLSGSYEVVFLPDSLYDNKKAVQKFFSDPSLKNKFILTEKRFIELKHYPELPVKGIIFLQPKKLIWAMSRAQKQKPFVTIDILDTIISKDIKTITVNFEAKFIRKYKANNVVGFIEGKKYPDSFMVFTAHFDHLGKMGKEIYFPGASDNASGVSMLLDLARHFSKPENQPDYSIVFITLTGEEVGLLGSTHFAENPKFPLENIKWLINLDMVGTGSDGITVVNSTIFPKIYDNLVKINNENSYIKQVKSRGESCNSDHCPFYQKGVPAVFIYSMGKENTEYHTITDTYDKMTFTKYNEIFSLLRDFINIP